MGKPNIVIAKKFAPGELTEENLFKFIESTGHPDVEKIRKANGYK